jgi:hypothetical protein
MPTKREKVLIELQDRAAAGNSLKSGDNRGDWLYTAAAKHFGSWGKAVRAAGFSYAKIKTRPMTLVEVQRELRKLVKTGERILAKDHRTLRWAASQHYGGWHKAIEAVGGDPRAGLKWTVTTVIEGIHAEIEQGLPVNSSAILLRNRFLYAAGRRCFGCWAAALEAAGVTPGAASRRRRSGRP